MNEENVKFSAINLPPAIPKICGSFEDKWLMPLPSEEAITKFMEDKKGRLRRENSSLSEITFSKPDSPNDTGKLPDTSQLTETRLDFIVRKFLKSKVYANLINETDNYNGNGGCVPDQMDSIVLGKPSFFAQIRILSHRNLKSILRNPLLFKSYYAVSIILGLMFGALFWNLTLDISGFQNRMGLFFFLLTLLAFSSMSTIPVGRCLLIGYYLILV